MKKNAPALLFLVLAPTLLVAADPPPQVELKEPDGTTIDALDLDTGTPVSIDPQTGALIVTIASGQSVNVGDSDVLVSLSGAEGGFFNVNGESSATVAEGGSVKFNRRARGAWSCTGNMRDSTGTAVSVAGWSDGSILLPFGSTSVSLGDLAPDVYTAWMTCRNGSSVAVDSATVDVEVVASNLQIPESCKGRQPGGMQASNVCWKGNETVDCSSYANVFGEFPGVSNSIKFFQQNNTYTTMKIDTTGLTEQDGSWGFEIAQFDVAGTGAKLMTISQCPGDFDQTAIEQEMGRNCYEEVGTTTGSVRWKRSGVIGARCELQTDQIYYLNILYTTDAAGTPPSDLTWDCSGKDVDSCGNLMAPLVTK